MFPKQKGLGFFVIYVFGDNIWKVIWKYIDIFRAI
jgi:hypothetical protein